MSEINPQKLFFSYKETIQTKLQPDGFSLFIVLIITVTGSVRVAAWGYFNHPVYSSSVILSSDNNFIFSSPLQPCKHSLIFLARQNQKPYSKYWKILLNALYILWGDYFYSSVPSLHFNTTLISQVLAILLTQLKEQLQLPHSCALPHF